MTHPIASFAHHYLPVHSGLGPSAMDRKGSGWLLEDQFHGDRDLALLWGVRDTAAARRVYWTSTRGINSMKHLLTGVGMVAALALSAATWAQPTSPGGNAVGMPGPNPGGPGLTP